jgi:hypothetical protein
MRGNSGTSELRFIFRRIDALNISEAEKLEGKAHLLRAETIANFVSALASSVKKMAAAAIIDPIRRRVARLSSN